MQMRSCPLKKTWARFWKVGNDKISQSHPANSGENFENECQERITAQKLITQFWGCYNSSPLKNKISSSRFLGLQHKWKDNHSGENLWVNFNPLVRFKLVVVPIIGTPRERYGQTRLYPRLGAFEIKLSKNLQMHPGEQWIHLLTRGSRAHWQPPSSTSG